MPPKKDEKPKDHFVEVMFILLVFGILILLWTEIIRGLYIGSWWAALVAWFLKYIWPIIIVLAILIALASIFGTIYNLRRLREIEEEERKIFGPFPKEEEAVAPEKLKNEKWERVITHMNSASASDWRLAIIEADVMLDELLRAQGYHGDSLGEMLKGVEKSDMLTLENAWEAHKVRNQVAHAGGDYLLNDREVRRVISLYESVFREFKII